MSEFLDASLRGYLDRLASADAVPGGGSAAGLAGAMAAALLCMAARFTVGRPRYAAFQQEADAALAAAEVRRDELQMLLERDAEAYAHYRAASALPKSSAEEQSARHAALQSATKASALAPMEIARACVGVLALAERLAAHCNPHLVSDVAVAAEQALSAFRSAALNVRINLASIEDAGFVEPLAHELRLLQAQAAASAQAALETAYQIMQLSKDGA